MKKPSSHSLYKRKLVRKMKNEARSNETVRRATYREKQRVVIHHNGEIRNPNEMLERLCNPTFIMEALSP